MAILGMECCPLWMPLSLMCAVLAYVYGQRPMSTWKRLGVPTPPSLPFIGHMHKFLNPKIGIRASIREWQKQYGKVFGIQFFRKPLLIVTDPDLFNEILVKEFNTFHDRFILGREFMPQPVLDGLAFQTGKDWKRNRNIMSPCFTSGKLKFLTGYMNTTARHLATNLQKSAKSGKVVKAKDVFAAFSLDVIAGTAFGLEINSQDKQDEGIFEKADAIFRTKKVLKLALALVAMFPFLGRFLRMLSISVFDPDSIDYFKSFLEKLIEERKKHPEQFHKWDFLQLFLDAEAEGDLGEDEMSSQRMLKPEEIVCHGITMIMAGYETSSSTLQFLSHILARNPDVQAKLVAEIESVFSESELSSSDDDNDDVEVTFEICQRLRYMEAVLNETLRMYPPAHQVKREASRDTTLAGYPVPKGAGIVIPIYNVGRDPEIFHDPDNFRPERFLSDQQQSSSPSFKPVQFLSFGFGPRQCIGKRLAIEEMKIALVHVLRKVRFQNVQPAEMDLEDYTGLLTPREPFKITLSTA